MIFLYRHTPIGFLERQYMLRWLGHQYGLETSNKGEDEIRRELETVVREKSPPRQMLWK